MKELSLKEDFNLDDFAKIIEVKYKMWQVTHNPLVIYFSCISGTQSIRVVSVSSIFVFREDRCLVCACSR